MSKKNTCLFVVLGLLLILISEYSKKPLNFYGITLSKDGGEPQVLESFPLIESNGGKNYLYRFYLDGTSLAYWQIIPDNELKYIKINERLGERFSNAVW